jgi:hypothetical protein
VCSSDLGEKERGISLVTAFPVSMFVDSSR